MSLDYALITSSSLPSEVKSSEYYVSVDKTQWLDLIEYSEGLVNSDPSQKVLFLIVAKGTPEQEAEDERRKKEKLAEIEKFNESKLEMEKSLAEKNALEEARRLQEKEKLEQDSQRSKELRDKSKSIFNALYNR